MTSTRKAAQVVAGEVGTPAHSVAWLLHQYGFRWDDDGHWTRVDAAPNRSAYLRQDDLLTLDDVAEILMTPVNTIRWWRQVGTGPQFFNIGRRLFITVGDLRAFIRSQRGATQPVLRIAKER